MTGLRAIFVEVEALQFWSFICRMFFFFGLLHWVTADHKRFRLLLHCTVISIIIQFKIIASEIIESSSFSIWASTCVGTSLYISVLSINLIFVIIASIALLNSFVLVWLFHSCSAVCTSFSLHPSRTLTST